MSSNYSLVITCPIIYFTRQTAYRFVYTLFQPLLSKLHPRWFLSFSASNVVSIPLYPNTFFNRLVVFHPLGLDLGAPTLRDCPWHLPSLSDLNLFPLLSLLLKLYAYIYHITSVSIPFFSPALCVLLRQGLCFTHL